MAPSAPVDEDDVIACFYGDGAVARSASIASLVEGVNRVRELGMPIQDEFTLY